jgi:hypothetical protein
VFVIRQQRIVGAEQPAGIGGVENRGEEIREVADLHRDEELRRGDRGKMTFDTGPAVGRACMEELRQSGTQRRRGRRPKLHQGIEMGCRTRRGGTRCGRVHEIADRRDIQNGVPDGDTDPWRAGRAARPECPVGQVLDREIAIRRVGAGDEALQGRIVGFVDGHR